MELKKSYKQTEVGRIPSDWEVKKLNEIGVFSKGQGVRKDQAQSGDIPCVRYGELYTRHHDYVKTFYSFITEEIAKTSRRIQKGDILFAGSGETKEEIGKCAAIIGNEEAYAGGDIIVLSPKNSDSLFLGFLLNSKPVVRQKASRGQGDAVVHISSRQLQDIQIPFPPLREQTAIATAISDVDALITSLENLITKKRNIKQGAMQDLLKPKKGWVVKKLGELGKTFGGLSGKSKNDFINGSSPYIPFMNIMANPVIDVEYFDYVNIKQGENQNKALKGDLFFNGSSETPEEVGMCSVLTHDVPNLYLNSFCFGFRLLQELKTNGLFLSYFFRSPFGRSLFFSSAQGATRYNLSKSNFMKLEVKMPLPEEQNRIANILTDMDRELDMLQNKLEKCKNIKQGMMQNLLTGKIRLV